MKCLYRHLFLEDTSKKARVTQIAPPKPWQRFARSTDADFVCGLSKHLWWWHNQNNSFVDSFKAIYFQLRKNTRNSCDVTLSNHLNSGMLNVKKQLTPPHHTTCFSEPQTNLGICRQGTLELSLPRFGGAIFE